QRLAVERHPQEVVRRGIADVALDRRIESGQLHQVGLVELALEGRRLGAADGLADLVQRTARLEAKRLAVLAIDLASLEDDARRLDLRRLALLVAREEQLLAVV